MPYSLVAFSRVQGIGVIESRPRSTPKCSKVFLWALNVHICLSVWPHTAFLSRLSVLGLAVYVWEDSSCPLLVLCQVHCFPVPALLTWLPGGLLCPGLRIPLSVLSLVTLLSISSVCLSDVGYADCIFVSVMLPS